MFISSELLYIAKFLLTFLMQKNQKKKFTMDKFAGPPFFFSFEAFNFDFLLEIKIRYKQNTFSTLIILCVQICYLNSERKANIISIDMLMFTGQFSVALMISQEFFNPCEGLHFSETKLCYL